MSSAKRSGPIMDFGHVLTSNPPIIESVFKALSWRDIEECSKVCVLWKSIAETELTRRKDIFSFFHGSRIDARLLEFSQANLQYLHLFGKSAPVPSKDSEESGLISTRNEVIKHLTDMKAVPYFCLIFATGDFVKSFDFLFPQNEITQYAKRRKQSLWNILDDNYLNTGMETVLMKYLPEQCKLACCTGNDIIGRRNMSLPFETSNCSAISGIVLPHIPGVKIYHFGLKCEILRVVPFNINIKCLLMYGNINFPHVDREVHNCLLREESKIAIGGSSLNGLGVDEATFVAFCGENVEAASIIINEKDDEKTVEEKLKLFKTGNLNDRSFVVLFSQNKYKYGGSNQKENLASIFHKLYPKIHITGVCGDVQIGVDYLPNIPAQQKDRLPLSNVPTRHYHSTVFVLISLKV